MQHLTNYDLTLNELLNVVIQKLNADPPVKEARIYYNTVEKMLKFHNGTEWKPCYVDVSGLLGTTSEKFSIDSDNPTPVMLKNNNGLLEIRNGADNDYADIKVKNLIVAGTTTTVNSEQVDIADNILLLNSNVTGTPTENGGIELERGTSTNATIYWDESTDKWMVGLVGAVNAIASVADLAGYQPLAAILTSIAGLAVNGIIARSAAGTVVSRTITGTSGRVTVTNGDGVSGNPTINVPLQMSITSDANGLKLSGDAATPGNNKYYGTDGAGNKGYFDNPQGTIKKFSATIGDGTATTFVVTHNLSTQDINVFIRESASPYAQVIADVEVTSINTITVKFGVAPTSGQYRVVVMG